MDGRIAQVKFHTLVAIGRVCTMSTGVSKRMCVRALIEPMLHLTVHTKLMSADEAEAEAAIARDVSTTAGPFNGRLASRAGLRDGLDRFDRFVQLKRGIEKRLQSRKTRLLARAFAVLTASAEESIAFGTQDVRVRFVVVLFLVHLDGETRPTMRTKLRPALEREKLLSGHPLELIVLLGAHQVEMMAVLDVI